MKKRIFALTGILLALLLVLAGCGSISSKDGGYYTTEAAAQESYNYDSAAGSVDSGLVPENAAEAAASVSAALPTGGFVILDTVLTADLEAEGYARDVIRAVQDARKAADLDIADRIALVLTVPSANVADVERFRDLIAPSFAVKEGAELGVEVVKA